MLLLFVTFTMHDDVAIGNIFYALMPLDKAITCIRH